jgi:hypothetical protein
VIGWPCFALRRRGGRDWHWWRCRSSSSGIEWWHELAELARAGATPAGPPPLPAIETHGGAIGESLPQGSSAIIAIAEGHVIE